jgi:hypothetical protein
MAGRRRSTAGLDAHSATAKQSKRHTPATPLAPGFQRVECSNGIVITHNLPDRIPILPAEIDIFRLYFSDLIDEALKPKP